MSKSNVLFRSHDLVDTEEAAVNPGTRVTTTDLEKYFNREGKVEGYLRNRGNCSTHDGDGPLNGSSNHFEALKPLASSLLVIECHLVTDPHTRESRGFGFVTMETNEDADRCIKYLKSLCTSGSFDHCGKVHLGNIV
ncbi:RNA recognition motif domain [Dillenia turbinata]|uniref:RNA recognition motif domain n=1 Tax=Dillenia turbinata TaxID=194707 RepID=A0AAN8ZSA2_9MAGN